MLARRKWRQVLFVETVNVDSSNTIYSLNFVRMSKATHTFFLCTDSSQPLLMKLVGRAKRVSLLISAIHLSISGINCDKRPDQLKLNLKTIKQFSLIDTQITRNILSYCNNISNKNSMYNHLNLKFNWKVRSLMVFFQWISIL